MDTKSDKELGARIARTNASLSEQACILLEHIGAMYHLGLSTSQLEQAQEVMVDTCYLLQDIEEYINSI